MQQPPHEVKLVLEALCIMKGIEPTKVPGEKPGTSFNDYLEPAKGLLKEPNNFLESLNKYDKVGHILSVFYGMKFYSKSYRDPL